MTPEDLINCKAQDQKGMMTEFLCFVRLQGNLGTDQFIKAIFHVDNNACESAVMQLIDTNYGVELRAGGYDAWVKHGEDTHTASADAPALALGAAYLKRYDTRDSFDMMGGGQPYGGGP